MSTPKLTTTALSMRDYNDIGAVSCGLSGEAASSEKLDDTGLGAMQQKSRRRKLRSLEAFEAVARHLSVSKAANELGITQSAVSHQMRSLAAEVGEKLFVVSGRKVLLTEPGRRLADRVRVAFGQIDRSVADVSGADRTVVRLAACTSFSPGWLVSRLGGFYSANPDVHLQLKMYAQDPELTDRVADAFVTTLPKELGFWSMQLRPELLTAVYAAARSNLVPGKLPLITTTLDLARTGDDWMAWCELADRSLHSLHTGSWIEVSHYVTAFDMAKAGIGIALVPDFLAEAEIASGLLRQLSHTKLPTHDDYYLCIKTSRRNEPGLRALADWFAAEIAV